MFFGPDFLDSISEIILNRLLRLSLLSFLSFFVIIVSLFVPLLFGVFLLSCLVLCWFTFILGLIKLLFHVKHLSDGPKK